MSHYLKYRKCAAESCKDVKEKFIKLFRFPNTAIGKRRYWIWADVANNPSLDREKMTAAYLCARHFARNQFQDADCTKLIRGAIPSKMPISPPRNLSLIHSEIPPSNPSCQEIEDCLIQENNEPSLPSFTLHDDIANLHPDLVSLWKLKGGIVSSGKELLSQLYATIDQVSLLSLKCREDEKVAAAESNPSSEMQLESQRLKRLSLYLSMVLAFLEKWKDREEKEMNQYLCSEQKMNWLNKVAVVVVKKDPNELNRALEIAQNMA